MNNSYPSREYDSLPDWLRLASEPNLDELISTLIKSDEEIEIENNHGWEKNSAPLACFTNCFCKEYADNQHNWKEIYPEYYWTIKRIKNIKRRIKRLKVDTVDELIELQEQLSEYRLSIRYMYNPTHTKT